MTTDNSPQSAECFLPCSGEGGGGRLSSGRRRMIEKMEKEEDRESSEEDIFGKKDETKGRWIDGVYMKRE